MTKADQIRLTLAYVRPLLNADQNKFLDLIWESKSSRSSEPRTIVLYSPGANLIGAIKEWRSMTGVGLKDAKDAIEATVHTPQRFTCFSSDVARCSAENFRGLGCRVELEA